MVIFINILASFVLLFSMFFALLPGGFGLRNFKRKSDNAAGTLMTVFYHLLWMLHIFAIYSVWAGAIGLWWAICIPVILIIIFFVVVGGDLGAA